MPAAGLQEWRGVSVPRCAGGPWVGSPRASSDWLLWDGILGGLCLGILSIRCQDLGAMTGHCYTGHWTR